MSNRLSFAQILQKKQPIDQSQNSYISSSQVKQQRSQLITNCKQQTPTLLQMMEEYCQYQEAPESNFVLCFAQKDLNMNNCSQNFVAGQNPLDSWIMTQSNFPKKQAGQLLSTKKYNTSRNEGCSMIEMSKKYAYAKENKQSNNCNLDHLFKFSSRTYGKSMQSLEEIGDSHKYGSTNPSVNNKSIINVQMIGDTKIIQSQAYGFAQCENKKENFSKIERSEKMNPKIINVPIIPIRNLGEEDGKKTFRYQNYEETDRKQTLDEEEQKQSINHRLTNNANHGNPHAKIMKKLSQEQQNLMAGIEDYCLNSEQKRIEDARLQINEYLKIKDKSPEVPQTTNIKKFQFLKKTKNSQQQMQQPIIQSTHVHYSFAQNEENVIENKDSFPCTKQQLQQINEDNQAQENQRMLSCIQYTQSEADGEEPGSQIQHEKDENNFNYRKLQVSQSIPGKNQKLNYPEPSTLEKYLPMNNFDTQYNQIQRHQFSPTNTKFTQNVEEYKIPSNLPQRLSQIQKNPSESIEEFSEIVEKVDVQPSIIENNSQRDEDSMNIMNSDHPRFRELSSGEIFQSIDGSKEVQPVYHDVSSIDIHISQEISNPNIQIQSSQPENHPFKANNECIKVPKLNMEISDISSVSNHSNIESVLSPVKHQSIPQSPIEQSQNKHILQAQSNRPVSSHESINLQARADGLMYAMRINSRNECCFQTSFGSSDSSLDITMNKIEGNGCNVEYKMNKNNTKYRELQISNQNFQPIHQQVQHHQPYPLQDHHLIKIKCHQLPQTDLKQSFNYQQLNYSQPQKSNHQPNPQTVTLLCNTLVHTKLGQNLEAIQESIAVQVIKNRNDSPQKIEDVIMCEIKQEIIQSRPMQQVVCANLTEEDNKYLETKQPIITYVGLAQIQPQITAQVQMMREVALPDTVSQQIQFEAIETICQPQMPTSQQKQKQKEKTIDGQQQFQQGFDPRLSLHDRSQNNLEAINTNHNNQKIYQQIKQIEMQVIKIQQPAGQGYDVTSISTVHNDQQQQQVQSQCQKAQELEVNSEQMPMIATQKCLEKPKIESMRSMSIAKSMKSSQNNQSNFEFDLDF